MQLWGMMRRSALSRISLLILLILLIVGGAGAYYYYNVHLPSTIKV